MPKPVLLIVADAVVPTGFARVAASLARRFTDDFEVHQLGLNYLGDECDVGWRLYPGGAGSVTDDVTRLRALLARLQPDLVLLVNDLDVLCAYAAALDDAARARTRFAAYFPVDSGPVEPELVRPVLQLCGLAATYTEFARTQVLDALRRDGAASPGREIAVIPHGVDQAQFRPLYAGEDEDALARSRLAARRALFPQRTDLEDAFIVLNANRNQPRKRIDTTLEGFALFARDKPPGVKLYLHMGLQDIGWNLGVLARRHGLAERLVFSTAGKAMPCFRTETLNLVYNACDVGLNTSSAEGWGLCSFEHAATGRAQIVPGHTSQVELWSEAGLCVPPRLAVTSERSLTLIHLLAPEDVATALERLHADATLRHHVARACLRRARDERFGWDGIARTWVAHLHALRP